MRDDSARNPLHASFSELSAYSHRSAPVSRRSELRCRTSGGALMTVAGPAGHSSCVVTVLDVSASGIGISSPIYIEQGSTVSLVMDSVRMQAEVRWCHRRADDDSFRAGLMIREIAATASSRAH